MAQELVIVVRHARRALALAVATASLAGCGWFGGSKDETFTDQPVEVLYNRALDDLGRQEYKQAAKEFEEVDRQHPYSVWATKAQIMAAFTYYQSNKYDDAIIALERLPLHPFAIDESSVLAALVDDAELSVFGCNQGVVAGDARVGDDQVLIHLAAHRKWRVVEVDGALVVPLHENQGGKNSRPRG